MIVIERLKPKRQTLEKRLRHLRRRISEKRGPNSFDRNEARALESALKIFDYYDRLRTHRVVESLVELLEALKTGDADAITDATDAAEAALLELDG